MSVSQKRVRAGWTRLGLPWERRAAELLATDGHYADYWWQEQQANVMQGARV